MLTEEGFKIRVAALRKEEEALSRERERLERDKARSHGGHLPFHPRTYAGRCAQTRFLREVKRLRDEDASRFSKVRFTPDCQGSGRLAYGAFVQTSVLGGRYVLQHLLGRGGFSEVFKARPCVCPCAPWRLLSHAHMRHVVCQAYDVDENRYVACKIHQLVPQWTEEHKRSYVRHAVRSPDCAPASHFAELPCIMSGTRVQHHEACEARVHRAFVRRI